MMTEGVFMRTILDIPEQDIRRLDTIKAEEGVSRNVLVKRAITAMLKTYDKPEVDAFGLWSVAEKPIDGLDYQIKSREEW